MATQEAVMTTQDVANRLHELFNEGKWQEAQEELFTEDAESIEPPKAQGVQSVKGLDAIKKKGQQFNEMVEEVHGGYVSDPIVAGNHIAFAMGMDCTYKGMGRQKMDEIAVYEVKDGKIVKEQFFY
jgi:hypothetical protein